MGSRYVLPTIVERTSHGEYAIDPYTKLFSDRIVFLGTAVDDTSANDLMAQLLYLDYDNPERDISVYINSPGGSVTAMMAIYDTMQSLASDVRTVCLGQAASAAALLMAAGTPGKRMMLPNARLIIHQPGIDLGHGQVSDLEIQAREVLRMRATMEDILARHTGQSHERIRADLDRDTILTASEALAYGLADKVLPARERREPSPVGSR
ncbi:ATP-dependent Clp protease proteolytic subunit [Dactylosporangium sp. AC04546]|uniref:ATP-dependent Clp protease proteolytic subunit n=1 Tax=Dactylosporangium sp. AC04546 TaxID=2862460 RepID=UPI001EE11BAB|nr:ATP-dependent Clp protease proteolytic subunit [Dactylosporangium sp. AC04546]WVK82617.1 ATP-dependent Clp protease proteolytic subunit [Dactylosporangium sp. AC04546]